RTPIHDDDPGPREYASPPCYMHEVDPAYFGLPRSSHVSPPADIAGWRQYQRARLIAQRLSLHALTRAGHALRIAEGLGAVIGDPAGRIISAYWPFRGEPDLRNWLKDLQD